MCVWYIRNCFVVIIWLCDPLRRQTCIPVRFCLFLLSRKYRNLLGGRKPLDMEPSRTRRRLSCRLYLAPLVSKTVSAHRAESRRWPDTRRVAGIQQARRPFIYRAQYCCLLSKESGRYRQALPKEGRSKPPPRRWEFKRCLVSFRRGLCVRYWPPLPHSTIYLYIYIYIDGSINNVMILYYCVRCSCTACCTGRTYGVCLLGCCRSLLDGKIQYNDMECAHWYTTWGGRS